MKKRTVFWYSLGIFFLVIILVTATHVLAIDTIADGDIISISVSANDDGDVDNRNIEYYTSISAGGIRTIEGGDCQIVRRLPTTAGCLIHACEQDGWGDDDDMAYLLIPAGNVIPGKNHISLPDGSQGECPDDITDVNRGGIGGCRGDSDNSDALTDMLNRDRFMTGTNDILCTSERRWEECNEGKKGSLLQFDSVTKGCIFNVTGVFGPQYEWIGLADADNDGFIAIGTLPADAFPADKIDCDDTHASDHLGAPEIPDDLRDNNCNGEIDENHGDADNDGDGYRDAEFGGDDCDDTNDAIHLDAVEICGNGVDENCNGEIDTDCDGDISQSNCEAGGFTWTASAGGAACCGDDALYSHGDFFGAEIAYDNGEYWSIYGPGGGQPSACFAAAALQNEDIAGKNLLDAVDGFSWEGGSAGTGLGEDTLEMNDNLITSSFIPVSRGISYQDAFMLLDVNLSGVRGEAGLRVIVEEGAREKADGSPFEAFSTPFASGSIDGMTGGRFIRVRYLNSMPRTENAAEASAAHDANKILGMRIRLEKDPGTIVEMKNIQIVPGTPSQIIHDNGRFYSCSYDRYENGNAFNPMSLSTLEYTEPGTGEPTGEPLVPLDNKKATCEAVGGSYCDMDGRWKTDTIDSDHPNDARKYLPGEVPVLPLPIFEERRFVGLATDVFRNDITGLQFYGIPLDMFGAGDFGYLFGAEPASVVSGFTELPPARSGCCPDNYCWNGYSCVAGKTVLNGNEPPDVVFNGTSYSCVGGAWQTRDVKKDQFNFKTGYCPTEQCYFNGGDMALTPDSDNRCVDSSFYDHEYYCEDGNWSTRTGLLAAQMLDGMVDDYELFCGEPETVLNNIDYTDVDVVKDFFYSRPDGEGNYHCDPVTKEGCAANNVCVLHYAVGGDDYVRFGMSLNIRPDARGAERSLSLLRLFPESFSSEAADHQDFCDSVIALPGAANRFYGCNRNDDPIEGENTNLWYNPKLNAIIYGKQGFTLEERDLAQSFKDFVKAPFSTVITRLAAALRIRSYAGDAEAGFLKDATRYNNVYLASHGSSTIRGLMDDVGNDAFMTVYYRNPSIDVCAKLPVMTALSGCASPTTCTCQSFRDLLGRMNYQISVKERNSFFLWPDLTGKIRSE